MKFLIIGSGAIGGFYGAKLAQGGAKVSCLCRSDFKEVAQNGFEIKSILGDLNFKPEKIYQNFNEINDEFDVIVIATKVLPQINLISDLKKIISKNSSILLLQNGIFIEENYLNNFPQTHLIRALAFIATSKIGPGKIHHQAYGRITIGDVANENLEKSKKISALLQNANIECKFSDNIQDDVFKKLVWNAAFNPISVAFGPLDTKEILDDENLQKLVKNIMNEIVILAKKAGHKLPEDIIEENITATQNMAPYKTSMLLDFENKRDLEIEAILGNAINFAKNNNIQTPNLIYLYEKFLSKISARS